TCCACRVPTGLEQDGHSIGRSKRVRYAPRENSRREVVDHGVQIRPGAVKQADDRRVDMPHLVRPCRAKPDLRLCRMRAEPRPSPAILPHATVPGRRRRRHGAEPLPEEGEGAVDTYDGWDGGDGSTPW